MTITPERIPTDANPFDSPKFSTTVSAYARIAWLCLSIARTRGHRTRAGARARAPPFIDPPGYTRHRPEATLLYQLVERYHPELVAARDGRVVGFRNTCRTNSPRI
jgi:hypothetical protein